MGLRVLICLREVTCASGHLEDFDFEGEVVQKGCMPG